MKDFFISEQIYNTFQISLERRTVIGTLCFVNQAHFFYSGISLGKGAEYSW